MTMLRRLRAFALRLVGAAPQGSGASWHPIYEPGTPQRIRDEYERVCEESAKWQSWFARVESEAERYQFALEAIRDHGLTHEQPCHALHNGDCAEVMQETARSVLSGTAPRAEAEPEADKPDQNPDALEER